MWGYYDGYTAAQVELMVADSPIVVYDREKKPNVEKKASALELNRAAVAYQKKQAQGGVKSRLNFQDFVLGTSKPETE